ncbi:uncharacterized protein LOC127439435 [Myxocyprinus asiaticus]|uniref:uncharacterized protein LOC127439435 n=1 Tax=Myxocyprinus asiaticus TaxID=70543 RepID=UPI002221B4BE|nr:uncharacterized protein LOC127439435 [Myxocyprinus asiaticus]XP_051551594.1 uncharacterized protein LOC127439435 [Myxocyprinus asiaticus]XP_051551595.1 uncharacterized protein LOC127439435 [Myxocyprinus asiaticus]XP_051551596.1 uncharacterized protein LOC127439435 [Myxocyprinus asiaticus]XP_051551597.1 uncharacterized protein LOC127439435 [Myxocyprinus asiaticus]XP_051551598.1 uncharacterized protein LOC127439435 [Myxocyprinus asiaticus]XP_051551599.1 uncharacterized protein LOC127439435 [
MTLSLSPSHLPAVEAPSNSPAQVARGPEIGSREKPILPPAISPERDHLRARGWSRWKVRSKTFPTSPATRSWVVPSRIQRLWTARRPTDVSPGPDTAQTPGWSRSNRPSESFQTSQPPPPYSVVARSGGRSSLQVDVTDYVWGSTSRTGPTPDPVTGSSDAARRDPSIEPWTVSVVLRVSEIRALDYTLSGKRLFRRPYLRNGEAPGHQIRGPYTSRRALSNDTGPDPLAPRGPEIAFCTFEPLAPEPEVPPGRDRPHSKGTPETFPTSPASSL